MVESILVSNVNKVGLPATGSTPAGGATTSGTGRPASAAVPAPGDVAGGQLSSSEGTAILNLTSDQFQGIRKLLIGLRLGKSIADDVRSEIFSLLSKGQRRVLGQAWFILSVRV